MVMPIEKNQVESMSEELKKGQLSPGIDKINKKQYKLRESEYIDLVLSGINSGKYNFTKYKQLLKFKGPNSYPRKISIPVLRDKLMLKCINEYFLKDLVKNKRVYTIIEEINKEINSEVVDEFIKIDIESFFDAIDLKILLSKLKENKIDTNVIKLVERALKTVTVDTKQNSKTINRIDETITLGVKQGIAISNYLAEIYLLDFDEKFNNMKDVRYFRFVDDILILYNSQNITRASIINEIKLELELLKLKEKESKRMIGKLKSTEFPFLGYLFKSNKISVSSDIVHKKERQIERVIFDFKNLRKKRPLDYLQWKLDLEITGFVSNNKFYGWLNVYQSLTDLSILYHLDNVVKKLLVRAGYDKKVKPASFVKSYHNVKVRDTCKIENFDKNYSDTDAKAKFLNNTLSIKTDSLPTDVIESIFNDAVHKLVFEFERDLDFKYGI